MSNDTPKHELEQLRLRGDIKFEEIVSCLSRALYSHGSPPSEADRERLIEEAEELTDKWAQAESENRTLELTTALQVLLSEHQAICKQIIALIDSGRANNNNNNE